MISTTTDFHHTEAVAAVIAHSTNALADGYAEQAAYLDDLALIEQAGDPTVKYEDLTDALRDTLRRRIAAKRDTSMLGGSGYDRVEADFYPTPQENVDCLLEHVTPHTIVWEPACGRGDISQRLVNFGHHVISTDLFDQGFGEPNMDFFKQTDVPQIGVYSDDGAPYAAPRAIITNPPYETIDLKEERWAHLRDLATKYKMSGKVSLAELFVRHALELMRPVRGQVAMFLRNEFDCGKGRMDLFSLPPFHKKIVVTKRPRWIEGSTGSPRHNYSWFVWDWRQKSGSAAVAYSHPDYAPAPAASPTIQ